MTTFEASNTAENLARPFTPEEIGNLVRTFRTMLKWTQDTLAELSGLQTRTIQRVEQGQPSSVDTRRAVARAFELNNLDYFNSTQSFPSEEQIRKQVEEFERENIILDGQQVSGRQLLTTLKNNPNFNALSVMNGADLPRKVHEILATITDYLRDCIDIMDDISHTQVLDFSDEVEEQLAELRHEGFCLCAAYRAVDLHNKAWKDQTPFKCHITYLVAAPKDHPAEHIIVPRSVSIGM